MTTAKRWRQPRLTVGPASRPLSAACHVAGDSISLGRRGVFGRAGPEREMVALEGQRDATLVEGLQRRAVADRDDRGVRQAFREQTVEPRFRRLVERGGGLVEEQILRLVQE